MTPTLEEKLWLRDYLYQALSYRETFDEVYDHILLALENRSAQPYFESTVYKIIDEDFGGSINMLNMEVECQRTIEKELQTQYWQTYFSWLKLPHAAYLLIIGSALFFSSSFNNLIFDLILVVIACLPLVLIVVRKISIRLIFHDKKTSIRDSAFKWLVYWYIIIRILIINPVARLLSFVLRHLFNYSTAAWVHSMPARFLGTFFFMITVIHILTLFELYREEFKTEMIKA